MPLTLRHPQNSNTGASGSSRVGHLEAMSQLGWLITEKNILKRVGQGIEAVSGQLAIMPSKRQMYVLKPIHHQMPYFLLCRPSQVQLKVNTNKVWSRQVSRGH